MKRAPLHFLVVGERPDLSSVDEVLQSDFAGASSHFSRESWQPELEAALDGQRLGVVLFHWRGEHDRSAFDELAGYLQKRQPSGHVPLLVINEEDSGEATLHALRCGAMDCLCRPLNINRLRFLLGLAASRVNENASSGAVEPDPIVYRSNCMQRLLDGLCLAARSDATILLTGETGTGKTRLASFVHRHSPRRHGPFVVADCGAFSATLIESELFGHVRGAFTGADQDREGKLERTGRGTLVLDEINSLPLPCQVKLLRVVDARAFERLGGSRGQQFEGRIIAASNAVLEREVAESRFRADLFYRLNVLNFTVPPLRQRPEDVAPLALYFLQEFAEHGLRSGVELADSALAALTQYPWPGNIRELRNVIERAVTLSAGAVIEPHDLHLPGAVEGAVRAVETGSPRRLHRVRHDAERCELIRVLRDQDNNRAKVARVLGISRAALYKRLDRLGLS